MDKETTKKADREFRKIAKQKLISPAKCKQLDQTRKCILELSKVIRHFEKTFCYVPPSAILLICQYNIIQEKMLFEDFQQTYTSA